MFALPAILVVALVVFGGRVGFYRYARNGRIGVNVGVRLVLIARVSIEDQNLEIQRGRFSDAGCEMLFEDEISEPLAANPNSKS